MEILHFFIARFCPLIVQINKERERERERGKEHSDSLPLSLSLFPIAENHEAHRVSLHAGQQQRSRCGHRFSRESFIFFSSTRKPNWKKVQFTARLQNKFGYGATRVTVHAHRYEQFLENYDFCYSK